MNPPENSSKGNRQKRAGKKRVSVSATPVEAGFPSPAEEYMEQPLDMNELLVQNSEATFMVRVSGRSMEDAGIFDGDILVVDKSVKALPGHIVVAVYNGEFTVKRLKKRGTSIILAPENPEFPDIVVEPEADFRIWGVVRWALHKL
ncbi:MAG: hypothetical protein Kow00127_13560 [Bacteroidales bacterium]